MAQITTDDGVRLHVEEAGAGDPILFLHEFGGHHLSWEPQLRHFARRYRCITYAARGWPPSDVPDAAVAYSQARAADDAASVLRALGIAKAHLVGLSMGATAALEFGIRHPALALSLKRAVPRCGLVIVPRTGHTINLEEPAAFNAALEHFLHAVERGRWPARDPREAFVLVPGDTPRPR